MAGGPPSRFRDCLGRGCRLSRSFASRTSSPICRDIGPVPAIADVTIPARPVAGEVHDDRRAIVGLALVQALQFLGANEIDHGHRRFHLRARGHGGRRGRCVHVPIPVAVLHQLRTNIRARREVGRLKALRDAYRAENMSD